MHGKIIIITRERDDGVDGSEMSIEMDMLHVSFGDKLTLLEALAKVLKMSGEQRLKAALQLAGMISAVKTDEKVEVDVGAINDARGRRDNAD